MDSVYVRTAADLERKYNLGELKRNVEINNQAIVKTNKDLEDFVDVTTATEASLQTQIDGKVDTWYLSGVPTLSNAPAVDWTTSEEKSHHIGDLYYNSSNSRAYIFKYSGGVYSWQELEDSDITTALANAQTAQDTADGKRRIFTTTPTPPYDVGDLWTQGSSGDIKVCNTAKASGQSYSSGDWSLSSKYTDDSSFNSFVTNTYNVAMSAVDTALKEKITTWYYSGTPTLSNSPASSWTTSDLKLEHVGDMYYDKDTGYAYRFDYSGGVYSWVIIHDSKAMEALAVANDALDTADGKRRVFTEQPVPPYDSGDLWVGGEQGDIKVCQVGRDAGDSFVADDWIMASKYTDDTLASAVVDELGGTTTTILSGQVIREMANYTKFTDLATGGSTTIAGENITTGSIMSQNYIANTSGTKIDLTDGTISTPYADIDNNGFTAKSKDGERIKINPTDGFKAVDKNNNPIYYADKDRFYMKNATITDTMNIANTIDMLYMERVDGNNDIINKGIGWV